MQHGPVRRQPIETSRPQSGCAAPNRVQTSPHDLWSQSFSQSYGSVLPTSLTYSILLTRGCSPWRPDAVIGTDNPTATPSLRFSRSLRTTPDHPIAGLLYQDVNPIAEQVHSRATNLSKRGENSFRGHSGLPKVQSCCHTRSCEVGLGILTQFPFEIPLDKPAMRRVTCSLRTG